MCVWVHAYACSCVCVCVPVCVFVLYCVVFSICDHTHACTQYIHSLLPSLTVAAPAFPLPLPLGAPPKQVAEAACNKHGDVREVQQQRVEVGASDPWLRARGHTCPWTLPLSTSASVSPPHGPNAPSVQARIASRLGKRTSSSQQQGDSEGGGAGPSSWLQQQQEQVRKRLQREYSGQKEEGAGGGAEEEGQARGACRSRAQPQRAAGGEQQQEVGAGGGGEGPEVEEI